MIDASHVKKIKIKKESPRDYRLVKHYDIIKINGIEKLTLPISHKNEIYTYFLYVMIEDIFII